MSATVAPEQLWSRIVQKAPVPPPRGGGGDPQFEPPRAPPPAPTLARQVDESVSSTKGIAIAVVDANAIIRGGEKLMHFADRYVSVREVVEEVRDPVSRHRLSFLPFPIETMEPSPEALKKVISFARATGDLQTLSDVDIKLIALTYTLEAQLHGTGHLRDAPPPLRFVNVKHLPEKDMPGWGSNVPNLEEWEALEHVGEGDESSDSRILPAKDLGLNAVPEDNSVCSGNGSVEGSTKLQSEEHDGDHLKKKLNSLLNQKKETKIAEKIGVPGIDASQGEELENPGDWLPAVSRKTQKKYLRRKARHDMSEASEDLDLAAEVSTDDLIDKARDVVNDDIKEEAALDGPMGSGEKEFHSCLVDELDRLEISSNADEGIDILQSDDASSEKSWLTMPLFESNVACVTSDFAMQNVILQIGLRLLAPEGVQIRQLHRWVLKCHACNKVTAEIGRIFCPKCGNGGTLRKVSVTIGENGIVLAARKPRVNLRGTKFSLPLPQGGRDAISKNLVLREDQLPHKLLYPKTKKKSNKLDDFFSADDFFGHIGNKNASLKPPVGQSLAVFHGKRNPNDNHFSHRKN
ncbi:hypothetical protein QJS04_geneDACA001967 [Acorus gramineus]|uniref:RNA-binding protein NOB1 n=1 Tax=Acorus gramineus TaxID=55184 RepID=A0AAV9A9V2_ACOGR|nr:hypothetical protein QJS04_geneDACA001967 [Acorus gramineus]